VCYLPEEGGNLLPVAGCGLQTFSAINHWRHATCYLPLLPSTLIGDDTKYLSLTWIQGLNIILKACFLNPVK
jgi:hypothetical protein